MENAHIAFLVLVALLIVITLWWFKCRTENFSDRFTEADTSTEFLQYVDMGDHRTLVHLQRGDSGRTVLLLHNSPLNLTIWQPLFHTMQRLSMQGSKTPNLVAYDLRGHGTAWMPVDPKYNDTNIDNHAWSLEEFVKDCKKIYDDIVAGGKICICGFGFGGIIAQKYALTYPNTVEKLVLLQTSTRPMPGLQEEINYLAGPTGWIAKNPHVTYLTNEETFVNQVLCQWFYLPKDRNCPKDDLLEPHDAVFNDEPAPQFSLSASLWREGSSTSGLQADKLLQGTDMVNDWIAAKNIPYGIHILAATDDPLAPPEMMANTYATIYNNNRHVLVVFDVVNGRHGFTIMRPDYIAGILCDDCPKVQAEDTYHNRAPSAGHL